MTSTSCLSIIQYNVRCESFWISIFVEFDGEGHGRIGEEEGHGESGKEPLELGI